MRTTCVAILIIAVLARCGFCARLGEDPNWALGFDLHGTIDEPATSGSDAIGGYQQTTGHIQIQGVPLTESVRNYNDKSIALFSLTYETAAPKPLVAFPVFDALPKNFHVLSYWPKAHSPVAFEPVESGSPWMIFDDNDNAFVVSPASHFFVQTIGGDGETHVASLLRNTVKNIPAGFTQQTLVAYGKGINHTWDVFGDALTALGGKTRPASDSDIGLKYLGYWTDNGTFYYYNFDPKLGYGGTLAALADHFREKNIPVKYMQLDSWWYFKSFAGADGKLGKIKNDKLPVGEWNRYGGLMEYRAHPGVFPQGLADFQKRLGLSIMTHNRWVDPDSPYQRQYRITGLAATDPGYWRNVIDYINAAGAFTYEQDWLSEIFLHSPGLLTSVDAGDEFMDGMANACRNDGMTMQYCMAMPVNFLEGSRYSNLTTIRPSTDRLKRDRWHDFLYGSRLASSAGIWPWTDSYRSDEVGNVLLSDLSGGMVGIGDELGKEDADNIFQAVRSDGVIVKPDAPIMPVDSAYIGEANRQARALVASTYTNTNGYRTQYVLAYRIPSAEKRGKGAARGALTDREQIEPATDSDVQNAEFSLDDLGVADLAYVYDFFDHDVRLVAPGEKFSAPLGKDGFNYYVVAQLGTSGIALFGDAGKFVSGGKQRIAEIHQLANQLTAKVVFAAGENRVTLHGCCPSAVTAMVNGDELKVLYDPASQHFSVDVDSDGPGIEEVVLSHN